MEKTKEALYEVVQDIIREYERFRGSRLLANHKILLDNINDELQSTEDRFILELIQNAVDSRAGDPIQVRFELQADRLVVANNGRPFTREDIERICGLSGERKKKKIGYKGIGFKSVARITDNPQIYSPGCQFEFDRRWYPDYDPLWLVIPRWIDRPRPGYVQPDWVTVVLPFKESVRAGDLYETFAGILTRRTGALLLFLDDLGQLEVEDSRKGRYFSMRKRVEENGLIAIEEKTDQAGQWRLRGRWLVVTYRPRELTPAARQDYSQRRLKSVEDGAADIGETTLTLAFHLDETNTFVRKQDGPVYAFLPLERQKSRLYFTVQADFLTDMSRKALAAPSAWNEWLIANIPGAIIAGIEQIKSLALPVLYPIIYEAFPLNRRISPPFDPVRTALPAGLKETRLVLTRQGQWATPAEAVWLGPDLDALLHDADIAALLPEKTAIVSPEIQGKEAEKFLRSLEVKFVTTLQQFIDLLEKNPIWLENQSIEWLDQFFGYLATARSGYAELDRLKKLPLIPVQDGRARANDGNVFFPDPSGTVRLAGVRLIRDDLPPDTLTFLREQFRLQPLTPLMQLEQVVLPALAEKTIPAENSDRLAEMIALAKAYYDQTIIPDRRVQQRLQAGLLLEAADGAWQPAGRLYLARDEDGRATPAGNLLETIRPDLFVRSPEALGLDFCQWLGVRASPPVPELLALLEDGDWLAAQSPDWFQRLYEYLEREVTPLELEALRRVPIVPVSEAGSVRMYTPTGPVFLPGEPADQGPPPAGTHRYVDPDFFPRPERARRFLEKVGLTPPKTSPARPEKAAKPAVTAKEAGQSYAAWPPAEQPITFDPEVAAVVKELRQKLGDALSDAGRLGEQLACIWLKRTLAAKHQGESSETEEGFVIRRAGQVAATIVWANKTGETYLPFDIKVVEDNNEQVYEVKSTTGPAGTSFKISMEEWMYARDQGSRAHILLIFEAIKAPKLIDIPDPYRRWLQNQLKVERFSLTMEPAASSRPSG